ncbi:hypothetical protein [Halorientalis marina]|jgi:hypothetical protein|uniref:hypothetical protein n=1 Tax=Halorientalis marina TaxID=2931976 RepID=UPI001FF1AC00|nr:hypothetical protein [Halorientalis marina]
MAPQSTDAEYGARIEDLRAQYRRDREAFEAPTDPPAADEAMSYLREGLGPVVMVYVDARANDWGVEFSQAEFDALHEALNGYLELYTRCYGVELDADFAIRAAAELLLETHNIRDVAAMLTQVPADSGESR